MKNVKKIGGGCKSNKKHSLLALIALVAIVAVSGLSMAACDDDSSSSLIDGTWESEAGYRFNISGSEGYLRVAGTNTLVNSAISRGYIRIGDPIVKNIRSTGNNTWSAQWRLYSGSNNVCTGTSWNDATLTLSSDGTLQRYASNATTSYVTYYRYRN